MQLGENIRHGARRIVTGKVWARIRGWLAMIIDSEINSLALADIVVAIQEIG
jgi:hypothetical protein